MKKQEMKNLIFQSLGEMLAGTELRLKRHDDQFIREIPGGRQMLGLPLVDYGPVFKFSLNICIRLEAVETIFIELAGIAPKYRPMVFTTNTPLSYFTGTDSDFEAETANDVAAIAGPLFTVVRDKIIPFLDAHTDVAALDQGVNRQEPGITFMHNPSGAMHSVILAALAGNSDFDRLVEKHRSDMQLTPETAHPFNALVRHLMEMSKP